MIRTRGSIGIWPVCTRTEWDRAVLRPGAGKAQVAQGRGFQRVPRQGQQSGAGGDREGIRRPSPTGPGVFSVFRKADKAGVLIFGMGNIGKSSLAARIANRMPKHGTVVVWERYDTLAIFERLIAALPGKERSEWERSWHEQIAANEAALGDALEEMLEGPFYERPLLIIDDLHEILEAPRPGQTATRIKDAPGAPDTWRISVLALLAAFEAADTESRLLLTSRYDFSLPDGRGRDLANALEHVQLHPMRPNERAKQWRAAERMEVHAEAERDKAERSVVAAALSAAGGNPGLQEILCRPILYGELGVAVDAIASVEQFKASGEVPTEERGPGVLQKGIL